VGIYRRGRIWWIDFYDQNRNRIQESSHSSRKRDAEALLNLRKAEVLRGVFRRPVRITLGEFGERYLEYARANKRSWQRDQQMLERLKEFFGMKRPLTEIGVADVENYKLHRRKAVSGSTVNRELALLKRMFNLAAAWGLYSEANPVKQVKFFREFNTGTRVLSGEEERRLLQNAAPYLQDLVRFALHTGLRVGEIFSLRWSHVDWERGILTVYAAKTGKVREVPLNADALQVLRAWGQNRRNEFVFYNPRTGKPFVDLKAGFRQACRKAGIEGVTWHTLRHTFASRLVNCGVDVVTVQELLGHSSLTVTMRYTHTHLRAKREAVQQLSRFGDNWVTVGPSLPQKAAPLSPGAPVTTLAGSC